MSELVIGPSGKVLRTEVVETSGWALIDVLCSIARSADGREPSMRADVVEDDVAALENRNQELLDERLEHVCIGGAPTVIMAPCRRCPTPNIVGTVPRFWGTSSQARAPRGARAWSRVIAICEVTFG
jgi:hypothetical protein